MRDNPKFEKESDLCRAFIAAVPDTWTAYPETGGFDILLVRKEDGFQVGVEAKLKLNAKVVTQAAQRVDQCYTMQAGPDCRAVLIPQGVSEDLAEVCKLVGVTVIRQRSTEAQVAENRKNYKFNNYSFDPDLPILAEHETWGTKLWHEFAPARRLTVPDYVPDTGAGNAAPIMLTPWKISAIRIVILLERFGFVTRQDFDDHGVSMSRWTQGRWIEPNHVRGRWQRGGNMPDFKGQHPVNFDQIAADFVNWHIPDKVERILEAMPDADPKRVRSLIGYNDGKEADVIQILKNDEKRKAKKSGG